MFKIQIKLKIYVPTTVHLQPKECNARRKKKN
jgi:hypothetical protein